MSSCVDWGVIWFTEASTVSKTTVSPGLMWMRGGIELSQKLCNLEVSR